MKKTDEKGLLPKYRWFDYVLMPLVGGASSLALGATLAMAAVAGALYLRMQGLNREEQLDFSFIERIAKQRLYTSLMEQSGVMSILGVVLTVLQSFHIIPLLHLPSIAMLQDIRYAWYLTSAYVILCFVCAVKADHYRRYGS